MALIKFYSWIRIRSYSTFRAYSIHLCIDRVRELLQYNAIRLKHRDEKRYNLMLANVQFSTRRMRTVLKTCQIIFIG